MEPALLAQAGNYQAPALSPTAGGDVSSNTRGAYMEVVPRGKAYHDTAT
jgi:hypothetical protein